MANAAASPGPDLLETWLILEYCDQGSFDHAIRTGKFTNDLVGESGHALLVCLTPCWLEGNTCNVMCHSQATWSYLHASVQASVYQWVKVSSAGWNLVGD